MADEIVAGRGVAEVRPAPGAPVIDKAHLSHQGPEPLRFAQLRISGGPEDTGLGCGTENSCVGQTLIEIERSIGSPDVEIDKSEPTLAQDSLRRSSLRWSGAQETHGFLYRSL